MAESADSELADSTAQIQIPISNRYLGYGYKGLVFCRNNS